MYRGDKKLLSIGTDRNVFREGSAVRARLAGYAEAWKEMHVVVFERSAEVVARGGTAEAVLALNCWAYSTRSRWKWSYMFDAIRLGKFIVQKRAITDVTCQDPFLTAMVGAALKRSYPHIRLEIQVHTDIGSPHFTYSFSNRLRKALALSYLPRADRVRVVSERIKKYLTDSLGIAAERIEVRPIKIDIEKVRAASVLAEHDLHGKYPSFKKIALIASRLEPEKDISLALRAWQSVVKRYPDAGLVIVGSGSERKRLEVLAKRLGIDRSVVFESWVESQTLYSYYKSCNVFLNTSLYEGYGMSIVEARTAGCPVISTDVGVARAVGTVIVGRNPEDIADRIADIFVV